MHTIITFTCSMLVIIYFQPWSEFIPVSYRPWLIWIGIGVCLLLVLRWIWHIAARQIRRRRPPKIHPRLQKYNIDHAELDRQRQEQARLIIATSTGNRLAGYRIVRQVEAVFVEGYRTPEEALTALKAAAAERGANALVNVKTERTSAGKCTASADAIVAAGIASGAKRPSQPPPTPKNE